MYMPQGLLSTMQLNLKHPLLGMGNQGLDLNTGTELHINS
jgi:hypothetical protein